VNKLINTAEFSTHLRDKGINCTEKKILITKFSNSNQEKDLTLPPNCNGFGRIHHFKRSIDNLFPTNPLPIDPASNYLKLDYTNEIKVQVFQNAFCSWRCWYCFVDYSLLSANPKHSEFKTAKDLVDLYLNTENPPPIIDLSGGQPDLVPEWSLWMADEIHKRNLNQNIYIWSDDNLSNDYLWKYLTKTEIKRLVSYKNYGRVGCFKGFDKESFSFNTTAEPTLWKKQFKIMRRLVETGFDMYGYVTLTSSNTKSIFSKMINFVDMLQEKVHPNFPLRTVPLKILEFTPTVHRMNDQHYKAIEVQNEAVSIWNEEIEKRFSLEERIKKIHEHIIR
jgi:uncharacterized Fe-S cluster-containing radical SAM superfamily protein